ncbi:MAG TPA: hypothetical protein VGL20_16420 [Candidatus Dormibacteraeota bacterium]
MPENDRRPLGDFHLGAAVHSSDGKHIGSLHRLVVDREGWDPHQVIVKESVRFNGHYLALYAGLMTDELIVPVSAIAQMSHDRVDLSLTSKEVRQLPPYLSYSLAPLTPKEAALDDVSVVLGAARVAPEIETADKAERDIELRPNENVMLGHDGHKLGHIRDVLFDEGELVGVVVHPVGFLEQDVVVQVRFLERSDDGALFVHMTPDDLRNLPPFHPAAQ